MSKSALLADRMAIAAAPVIEATIDGGHGTAADDVIINAHDVQAYGGSDTVTGTGSWDWIEGFGVANSPESHADGGDLIDGRGGDDFLIGDGGADRLIGGEGDDNLFGGGDSLDTPITADLADTLDGGVGQDELRGNYGDDVLGGGVGDDTLSGHWGSDFLNGGDGFDTAIFDFRYESTGVSFNVSKFTPMRVMKIQDGLGGSDKLTGIERLALDGSNLGDTLVGSAWGDVIRAHGGANLVAGGGGDDQLSESGGNSTLRGGGGSDRFILSETGPGHDSLDGGAGFDTVVFDFSDLYRQVNIVLDAAGSLQLDSFENTYRVNGQRIEAMIVSGSNVDDRLSGGRYGDWIDGALGRDTMNGNGGADTIVAGGWGDVVDGGAGSDVFVIHSTPGATDNQRHDVSGYKVDGGPVTFGYITYTSIEGWGLVTGSGNDTLIGSAGGDLLMAGKGQDSVLGGEGDDVIVNQSGAGTIFDSPEDARDVYEGGAGFDILRFENMTKAVVVDLRQGLLGIDYDDGQPISLIGRVRGIEGVESGLGADSLVGSGRSETFSAGFGADTISAGGGRDVLDGGFGADVLIGGSEKDVFRYSRLEDSTVHAADLIGDLEAGDVIDLSALDADVGLKGDQAFVVVEQFTGVAGQLTIFQGGGSGAIIADVDGDGVGDLQINFVPIDEAAPGLVL